MEGALPYYYLTFCIWGVLDTERLHALHRYTPGLLMVWGLSPCTQTAEPEFLFFYFNWITVDLQCYISFKGLAKWLSCVYILHYIILLYYLIYVIFQILFPYQIRSVAQLCPTLCDPMNCSTPGFPVHHQLPEFTQTHVHPVSDAIQPSHPLSSPSPPAPNPSQHQSLFQWVNSSHEVAKVLEFQL